MLPLRYFCRIDDEPVVLCTLGVCPVEDRVIGVRSENPGFQVIQHNPLRNTSKELEGVYMAFHPCYLPLIKDKLNVGKTAI